MGLVRIMTTNTIRGIYGQSTVNYAYQVPHGEINVMFEWQSVKRINIVGDKKTWYQREPNGDVSP